MNGKVKQSTLYIYLYIYIKNDSIVVNTRLGKGILVSKSILKTRGEKQKIYAKYSKGIRTK